MLQDLRYAFRAAVRNPAFMLVVVGSLALGIGANTTIFTVINAIFLRPLPVAHQESLVAVFTVDAKNPAGVGGGGLLGTSMPNYRDYRDRVGAFSGLAAYQGLAFNLGSGSEPEQVQGQIVTGNFFDVLGVPAAHGRTFLPEEDAKPGASPVVVLSDGLWKRRFGADPGIVNRQILLDGLQFTVIGVAPEGFKGLVTLGASDVYVPMMMHDQVLAGFAKQFFEARRFLGFNLVGRLKPGVTMQSAGSEMQTQAKHLEEAFPVDNEKRSVKLQSLAESAVPAAVRGLLVQAAGMLLAASGVVLLIACGNIASLLLARATTRRKEIAIRLSLGAPRWRLIRQLLIESTMLALMGGGFGVLIAFWGRDALWSLRPPFLPANSVDLSLDPRVLGFTMGLSVITGLLFGLVPAIQASRADLVSAIKSATETGHDWRFLNVSLNLRGLLVVGQVALSLVALIGAGLFLRSLQGAQKIDPGFKSGGLATITVDLGAQNYQKDRGLNFYRAAMDRVRGLPGVQSVTWTESLPLFGGGFGRSVFPEGEDQQPGQRGRLVQVSGVWTGYFSTMGIPIEQGRDFLDSDRDPSAPMVIMNQTAAKIFWPGQNPIGKRFKFYGEEIFTQVVGIAKDGKYNNIGEDPLPFIYYPAQEKYVPAMSLAVRTSGDPRPALAAMSQAVRGLDSTLPLLFPQTMSDVIDASLWAPRMGAMLLALFGLLALVLAAVGIYGVMSYSVTRRTREIGIRMALGARTVDVLRLVLGEGMILTTIGMTIGLAGAVAATRLISGLLFGVSPTDLPTFVGISALLAAVAMVANYLPARRASRVDPLVTLKYE